jgi:hypothetical protein
MIENDQSKNRGSGDVLEVTGLIAWTRALWLTSYSSLLVLDAQSWITSVSRNLSLLETEADEEGKAHEAFTYACMVADLEEWLEGGDGLSSALHPIAFRQMLRERTVRKADLGFERHIAKVMALARQPGYPVPPEFVWVVSGRQPTMYVTEKHRHLAEHSGPDCAGVIVDQQELNRICGEWVKKLP